MSTEIRLDSNLTSNVCGYTEECGVGRFSFVMASSILATLGAGANLILACVFTFRTVPVTPSTLYPTFLAVLDALICVFYVLFFGVDVFSIFLGIESLFLIYHGYILPFFVFSKCVQLAIPYILIFVTLERYAWISNNKRVSSFCMFTSKAGRIINIIACFAICILLRVPSALALTVHVFPDCENFFRSLAVSYKSWVKTSEYFKWYDFQLVSILQVLYPFVVLVILNSAIVIRLAAINRANKNCLLEMQLLNNDHDRSSKRFLKRTFRRPSITPAAVRSTVYTTVAIVSSYLVCSGMHLVLTAFERFDSQLLVNEDDPTKASSFHTIMGDIISFLYMLTSAIRVVIYWTCNPCIKISVQRTLNIWSNSKSRRLDALITETSIGQEEQSNGYFIQV